MVTLAEPDRRHTKPFVLTVNPADERTQELLALLAESEIQLYVMSVAGFGPPELRLGSGDYIRGFKKIRELLNSV